MKNILVHGIILAVWMLGSTGLSSPMCHADDLATSLHRAAKEAVAYCKQNEIRSLGVLKFLVVKDGETFSDNVGTINTLLARRFDVALVMANDPVDPITLIDDASATAKTIIGADHMSSEGRSKLLAVDYAAMWGNQSVRPDALITGIAEISSDLRRLTVSLLVFTKNNDKLDSVGSDHVANVSANLISEIGESFSTRGAFDGGKVATTNANSIPDDLPTDVDPSDDNAASATALASATSIRQDATSTHPILDPQSPVRMRILYDGRDVPIKVRDGRALVAEPNTGQRVEISLTKDDSAKRYKVVLKVNGQNTLNKQQLPDAQCRKWILPNPGETTTVRGFQISDTEIEQFQVLSRDESAQRSIDYGSDVGTISITVFAEGKAPVMELDEDAREADLVESATLPEQPSANFGALKAKLLADANRGLVVEGDRMSSAVRTLSFHADPTPIMSATVVYYKP
ncbi:MAG: hypothetical protein WBD31_03970 [Rubripirellula sp.]